MLFDSALSRRQFERSIFPNVVGIESRDDVDMLRYSRRRVVIGAAEYLAGLQFWGIVVAGLPDTRGMATRAYQLRRFLSLMYLAVSRATRHVEIHVNDDSGGVPRVLELATQAGALVLAATAKPNS
jgi:isopropylmalate/homocitrate/citramalate synthase